MQILKTITDDFWWDVARKCEYATFFHTPIWRDFALRLFTHARDATVGAILPSGVRIVFPLLSTRRYGPFQRLMSTAEGCYGGLIADGPVSPDEAVQLYAQATGVTTLSFRFLENPIAPALAPLSGYEAITDVTNVVVLDADFDTIFGRFSKNHRNAYRRGIKENVQVRIADKLEDYRVYYAAYRDTVVRWGKPADYGYSWPVFEQCFQLSRLYPENIKLWLTHLDGQITGGTLVFYWNTHSTAWHGAMYREYMGLKVMNVVDTEIIRDAIDKGYRYYDLNTSSGLEGISDYKSRFGSVQQQLTHWRYQNPLVKRGLQMYRRLRRQPEPIALTGHVSSPTT